MNRYSIAEFQTAEEDGEVNPETLKLSAGKDMKQKTFGTQVKQSWNITSREREENKKEGKIWAATNTALSNKCIGQKRTSYCHW